MLCRSRLNMCATEVTRTEDVDDDDADDDCS